MTRDEWNARVLNGKEEGILLPDRGFIIAVNLIRTLGNLVFERIGERGALKHPALHTPYCECECESCRDARRVRWDDKLTGRAQLSAATLRRFLDGAPETTGSVFVRFIGEAQARLVAMVSLNDSGDIVFTVKPGD